MTMMRTIVTGLNPIAICMLAFVYLSCFLPAHAHAGSGVLPLDIPGPNDTICKGDTSYLSASNPLALGFVWSPAYNISNTVTPNPFVYPAQTTMYHVAITGITTNLIVNGNFSSGNVGFTSAYTYTTNLWPEATYCIGPNPNAFHANFAACTDHTTGAGNMMVVNGAGTPNTTIWQQNVTVVPNSNYVFSCWLTSVTTASPAMLQFFVNNVQIGPVFQATPVNCNWNMFYNTWNSGTATTATITIKNQNTATSGNDFAIDDLFFAQLVTIHDSTLVVVEDLSVDLGPDTVLCLGESMTFTASSGPSAVNFNWKLDGVPTGTPQSSGTYTLNTAGMALGVHQLTVETNNGSNSNPCSGVDTVLVNVVYLPDVNLGNDTVICDPSVLTLDAGQGFSYVWNNGASTQTIQVNQTGLYTVLVDGWNGTHCKDSDSIMVTVAPMPYVDLGPDTCSTSPITLDAGNDPNIFSYYWSNGATTQTLNVTQSGTYIVTVTAVPGSACGQSDAKLVNIVMGDMIIAEKDGVSLGAGDQKMCTNQKLTFKAPVATPPHTYAYLWSLNNQPQGTSSTTVLSMLPVGIYNLSVDVGGGCTGSINVEVVDCEIIIPNIFTPNGDGVNESFTITGAEHYPGSEMIIYNRWGKKVFESSNYTNDKAWNAEGLSDGVYYYVFKINDGRETIRSGTVTVMR
jgi:gliding motility-associated-like protein